MRNLKNELEKAAYEPSFYEYLDHKLESVKKGLKLIQAQAKKDLGVK